MASSASMTTRRLGRPDCTDLGVAERREWLVTNGRGSYAMGTVAGTLTRTLPRAADRRARAAGGAAAAGAVRPARGPVPRHDLRARDEPLGVRADARPRAGASSKRSPSTDGVPAWTYALGDAELEVAIAMPYGLDRTAVALRVVRARRAAAVHGARARRRPRPSRRRAARPGALRDRRRRRPRRESRCPTRGRTLHVSVPGAVLSARARPLVGLLRRARERARPQPDRRLPARARRARSRSQPGERGGVVVGLEPDGDDGAGDRRRRARARRGAGGATNPIRCARNWRSPPMRS